MNVRCFLWGILLITVSSCIESDRIMHYEFKGFLIKFQAIHGGSVTQPLFVIDHYDNVFLKMQHNYPHQMRFFLQCSSASINVSLCGMLIVVGISWFRAFFIVSSRFWCKWNRSATCIASGNSSDIIFFCMVLFCIIRSCSLWFPVNWLPSSSASFLQILSYTGYHPSDMPSVFAVLPAADVCPLPDPGSVHALPAGFPAF